MKVFKLVVIVFHLLSFRQAFSQEILVSVDTNQALIGEQIIMSIQIKADKETKIQWPIIGDSINGLEVIKKTSIDTLVDEFGYVYRQRCAITAFDTGVYKIDSVVLRFQRGSFMDSLVSYPVFLAYNTVKLDSTNKYYDIKKPLEIKYNYWFEILMGILAGILLAAGIYFLYKRRKPSEVKTIKVLVPPYKTALKKLHEMQENKAWLNMKNKSYYIELTTILRQYIYDQHQFNALESTSDEIMEGIKGLSLNSNTRGGFKELLQVSDLVKFAKAHPLPEEGEQHLKTAFNFINDTRPRHEELINNKNDA